MNLAGGSALLLLQAATQPVPAPPDGHGPAIENPRILQPVPAPPVAAPQALETRPAPREEEPQLRFFGYFLTRAEVSNVAPANELLRGQTLGRLFGPNTTTTGDTSVFVEQRFIPLFIFEPHIVEGFARLRASFDLRWTWGDTSYGVGGSFGGAINGHQVNLQTQNVEIEFNLAPGWFANLGLQRLFDNARDPYRSYVTALTLTGNRLAFWGADAAGLSIYGRHGEQAYKLGVYDLYSNAIDADDDVVLFEALTDRHLGRTWHLGGHLRYLRDTSNGSGGVGILGQGLTSPLADYNGAFRFPASAGAYNADLFWVGLDSSWNPDLASGRVGASAFVAANLGNIDFRDSPSVSVAGVAANVRGAFRYGRTPNDSVSAEVLFTSGDEDGAVDGHYSGVITGNTWGAPGAAFTSSGAYLLLPHASVVNRAYAAVFDIANLGLGLTATTLNLSHDFIPNRLLAKMGTAVAASNVGSDNGGSFIGVEANGMLAYRLAAFFTVEVHAAYLWLGTFFDSGRITTSPHPANPWTSFMVVRWLLF